MLVPSADSISRKMSYMHRFPVQSDVRTKHFVLILQVFYSSPGQMCGPVVVAFVQFTRVRGTVVFCSCYKQSASTVVRPCDEGISWNLAMTCSSPLETHLFQILCWWLTRTS